MAAVNQYASDPKPYEPKSDDEKSLEERVKVLIGTLSQEADRRVRRRSNIEARWLENLRLYHGIYETAELTQMKENSASQIFINQTRPKTDALIARLGDLLFPTDDRNWGIQPTPVPQMDEELEESREVIEEADEKIAAERGKIDAAATGKMELMEAAGGQPDPQQLAMMDGDIASAASEMDAAGEIKNLAEQKADELQEAIREASRRSDLMQEEIQDQLKACSFQAEARDAIEHACKLGTGVMKGPVTGEKVERRYTKGEDNVYVLEDVQEDKTPSAMCVDPWTFFPDPDLRRMKDNDKFFERHLKTRSQLRKMSRMGHIDEEAIKRLLKAGPEEGSAPSYMVDLHGLTNQSNSGDSAFYQVWEFTGVIEPEDLETMLVTTGKDDLLDTFLDEEGNVDVLAEVHARIWFCQGELLSFALHPLDTGEPIYSTFCLMMDEAGPWGYGLPHMMADPQRMLNSASRMMMDNAALAIAPQVIVNHEIVVPADGSWTLKPRKIWYLKNSTALANPQTQVFRTETIPMEQGALNNIIELALRFIDDMTSMPAIAQGEQGAGVTKTAQGMGLLMTSANVVFRRIVKNWDDDMTVPIIRRFYHFNMQFSEKTEIMGDYDIDARGSSVLLVREMQAQNLVMIAQMFGDHPIYGPMIKHENLLEEIFKAHMIPAAEITRTQREMKEFMDKQAGQGDPAAAAIQAEVAHTARMADLEEKKLSQEIELANMKSADDRYKADRTFEAAMQRISGSMNMTLDQLETRVAEGEAERNHKERIVAVEAAKLEETGVGSGTNLG